MTRPGHIQRIKKNTKRKRRRYDDDNYNENKENNVLYCGASTRPGNGVPLVLIGAEQVAKKAIKFFEKEMETENEAPIKENS